MQESEAKKSIFISYSRKDLKQVYPLVLLLRLSEVEVFWDKDSIEYGSRWEDVIETRLKQAGKILVFWSQNAAQSDYVRKEYAVALKTPGIKIVPVPLDQHPLTEELAQFHSLTELAELLDDIARSLPATGPPISIKISQGAASERTAGILSWKNATILTSLTSLFLLLTMFGSQFFWPKSPPALVDPGEALVQVKPVLPDSPPVSNSTKDASTLEPPQIVRSTAHTSPTPGIVPSRPLLLKRKRPTTSKMSATPTPTVSVTPTPAISVTPIPEISKWPLPESSWDYRRIFPALSSWEWIGLLFVLLMPIFIWGRISRQSVTTRQRKKTLEEVTEEVHHLLFPESEEAA